MRQWLCTQVAPGFLCDLLLGGSISRTYQAKKKKKSVTIMQDQSQFWLFWLPKLYLLLFLWILLFFRMLSWLLTALIAKIFLLNTSTLLKLYLSVFFALSGTHMVVKNGSPFFCFSSHKAEWPHFLSFSGWVGPAQDCLRPKTRIL